VCAPKKEIMFFIKSYDDRCAELGSYLKLFDKGANARYRLDASPHYAFEPMHQCPAADIRSFNEDAKILYIVRHPTARTISHWALEKSRGNEKLSLTEAIAKKEIYTSVSDYKRQLMPYIGLFGKKSVEVIVHEELVARPRDVMTMLHYKLGLRDITSDEYGKKFNKAESNEAMSRLTDEEISNVSLSLAERQRSESEAFRQILGGRNLPWKFPLKGQ